MQGGEKMKIYSVPKVYGGSYSKVAYVTSGFSDVVLGSVVGAVASTVVKTTIDKPDIVVKGITGGIAIVDTIPGPAVPG